MRDKTNRTEQRRMWYGMSATVTIGPGFLHTAGFGAFLLPHPPVINWLLRKGLPEQAGYNLSFTHEFGHLQTLPSALLYTSVMLMLASFMKHFSMVEIILVLISTHAAWEMMAEIRTIADDVTLYRKYYENITVIPRAIFWILTGTLAVMGWFII